jgi:hypothetical protein
LNINATLKILTEFGKEVDTCGSIRWFRFLTLLSHEITLNLVCYSKLLVWFGREHLTNELRPFIKSKLHLTNNVVGIG